MRWTHYGRCLPANWVSPGPQPLCCKPLSGICAGRSLPPIGKRRAAAAEFQKLIDHRGIVAFFVLGALAHLQLGRTYALEGDKAKALAAYKDFLTLWKDADPDIPILKEAKAEYAKLQ